MDRKTLGIVAYVTLVGWIIALIKNKPKDEYVSFHIRQMLGLIVVSLIINIVFGLIAGVLNIGLISLVGFVISAFLWVVGLMGALKEEKKLIPVIGAKSQDLFKGF